MDMASGSRDAVSGVEISATQERRQERIGALGWGRNEKQGVVKHKHCLKVLELVCIRLSGRSALRLCLYCIWRTLSNRLIPGYV